jgi:2-amino-4-hydroxy-6-hydroxymethyldihydropteridine diphosphokinase
VVILGLGGNIGDRLAYLREAVARLSLVLTDLRVSRVLESASLEPDGVIGKAPAFYNMAVAGECALSPLALLAEVKAIEQALGRQARGYWGSREIDIDILAIDDLVMQEAGLTLPHAHMLDRDFVMLPVADVAPEWRYPGAGECFGLTPAEIIRVKGYGLCANLKESGLRAA